MKYLDEFRDPVNAKRLIRRISSTASQSWTLMDVCGGQTHSLVRSGIERELSGAIELIHGPGCPVCVTPAETIDFAITLAHQPDTILASFGDMLRVPGSSSSLLDARASGGNVKLVYSPIDAVTLAAENPGQQVVFLGVGFETTAPATALAVRQASERQLDNFTIIPAHVRVEPAMAAIMDLPENRVQAFLAAGHVCVVTGYDCYDDFVQRYRVPVVVTGFEPIDLLEGILDCVKQLESGVARVRNRYERNVTAGGNQAAQDLIDNVYAIADRPWRGFGIIEGGGYELKPDYLAFDAVTRFAGLLGVNCEAESACRGADVMSGKIRPKQCPEFGVRCTPESPLGAPMVSSEGACAAYYRFDPISPACPTCTTTLTPSSQTKKGESSCR